MSAPSSSRETVAVLLRRYRLVAGLTQEELADKARVSVRTVRNAERADSYHPRVDSVRRLAAALGLGADDRRRLEQARIGDADEVRRGGRAGAPGGELDLPVPAATWAPTVPAQLPADVPAFTGRGAELADLDTLLAGTATGESVHRESTAVVISAVSGAAGVGKTALAVRWAHRARGRFPDGQLYVNLRGYDPDQPMTAADALARLLGALGVAGSDIPLDLDDRAARYRTETAGRRMLILLDNAATAEQVRPLLPGTGSCAVLVTSRDSMAGLVAVHGAHRLDLDLLPPADARTLLRRLIGPRVDAEPEAAATLATLCGRLPLALRVAAELAVSRPVTTLGDLAADLAGQQQRLDLLDAGGDPRAAVTSVFSWSVRHLPPDAVRTFRLLGLHPGPDLDAYAAAALVDTSVELARRTLGVLARANLVHPTAAARFGMHDLLRAYATGLATAKDAPDDCRAALGRLFDHYLATATAAMDTLYPAEVHRRPRVAPAATPAPAVANPDTARAWLDTERAGLTAVAAYTAGHGWPTHTVRLSTTLFRYLDGGHHVDALAIHSHARAAARQTGDLTGEARALLGLGTAHLRLGRHRPTTEHYEQALMLFRRAADPVGEGRALGNLAIVEERLGRYRPAADYHEQALVLFRRAGDRTGEARALTNLGIVEKRLGRYHRAAEHHELALALFRQAGDRSGEATALNNLGSIEERLGRYEPAVDHLGQSLSLNRQLGNRSGEGWALDSLGTVYARVGRPDEAAEYHRQALRLFREIGERDGEAWALNGLGEAAHATRRPAAALTHQTAALRAAAETGSREQQARAHAGLGRAHHALGGIARAREHYERALALYTDLNKPNADDVRARLAALPAPLTKH